MMDSHDLALQHCPNTFNRLGVRISANVFTLSVVDYFVMVDLAEAMITDPLIGNDNGSFGRNVLADEAG